MLTLRVIIAEDERLIAEMFRQTVTDLGYCVVAVTATYRSTIDAVNRYEPDVVFLDISMDYPEAGLDACRYIKKVRPDIRVYFLTAYSDKDLGLTSTKVPYDGFIEKLDFEFKVSDVLKELKQVKEST